MAPNKGKQKVDEEETGILEEIPAPITTFNLSNPSKFVENYENCVKDIRSAMEENTDVKFTIVMIGGTEVVVPVTPAEDSTKKGPYVIRLTDGEKSLDLVADKYQTWFRGIVTGSEDRFGGIYPKLLDCNLFNLIVGYQQLIPAFYTLVGHEGDEKDNKKVKEAIAILLIMFFEGPRLLPVQEFIQDLLRQFSSAEVGKTNAVLINNWCDRSMVFYEGVASFYEGEADTSKVKVFISEETSVKVREAAATLRIMCRSKWEKWIEEQMKKETNLKPVQNMGAKTKRGESSIKK